MVITLKEPMTAAEVRQGLTHPEARTTWSEQTVNGLAMNVVDSALQVKVEGAELQDLGSPNSFFMPSNKVVVFGIPRDLKEVMQRKAGPELSPGMERALALIDWDKPYVAASDGYDGTTNVCQDKLNLDVDVLQPSDPVVTKAVRTELGPEVVTTSVYVCKDAKAAQSLKDKLTEATNRVGADRYNDAADLFKGTTRTIDGSTLTVRQAVNVDQLAAWGKKHPKTTILHLPPP
jgi:hypothetical protein